MTRKKYSNHRHNCEVPWVWRRGGDPGSLELELELEGQPRRVAAAMGSFFIDPSSLNESFFGNFQLIQLFIAYSYLLYIGCNMISDGAELLMLTPYSKLVGSCILPILGAVPDGAIVLFSGLGPGAQESLAVGVGALAGSTVMLITIPWALAIYGGRVDLDARGNPRYSVAKGTPRLSSEKNLFGSGVSVGAGAGVVRTMGLWMLATAVPYVVVEIGALVAESAHGGVLHQQSVDDDEAAAEAKTEGPVVLVGLIAAFVGFCGYLKYQFDQAYGPGADSPALEKRQRQSTINAVRGGVGLVAAVRPILEAEARARDRSEIEAPLSGPGASATLQAVLAPFFAKYDADRNGTLEVAELGRVFADINEPKSKAELAALFAKYDGDGSGAISFEEFCLGIKAYVLAKPVDFSARAEARAARAKRTETAAPTLEERKDDCDGDDDEEEADECPDEFAEGKFESVARQQAAIKRAAIKLCGVGTAIVLVFSDPITDVLTEFGTRTGISAFYVGFVVAPLITNGSELLASYTFALKKTQKSMVVAYEQLLGAAIMNNTYCLFIFLLLIYSQKLYWNYTAEVLAILFAEVAMFFIATRLKVHTLKTAALILSIYPATLAIVWLLENLAGIS